MFDVAPSEFMLIALVALVVIGPKELPRLLRTLGQWVGRARAVARQFRSGFDDMVRESELAEMEKKWREENERIMREFPAPDVVSAQAETAGSPDTPMIGSPPPPAAATPKP
jgi:sec-independent protein translocase protein TatB